MWNQRFFNLMASPNAEDWSNARRLRDENLPTSLYKYRAPTDLALQNLSRGMIWCASPNTLNDPYDCSLLVPPKEVFRQIVRKLQSGAAQEGFSCDDYERMSKSDDPVEEGLQIVREREPTIPEEACSIVRAELNHLFGGIGRILNSSLSSSFAMCSFSAQHKSLVMWSHYAESHAGFCVEYAFRALKPDDYRRQNLFPVVYHQERFNLLKETSLFPLDRPAVDGIGNIMILSALRKSTDWAYEDEWRLVTVNSDDAQGHEFPAPSPVRILLGAKMTSAYRSNLLAVAERLGVPCFQGTLGEHSFLMEFDPIT